MIDVRGLTKRYGATLALDRVSFTVDRGEVLGFLGPNGAGKTTTMRILTCFMPADEGTATLAGFDIQAQSLEVRRRVGYLPENSPLYLDMKVHEYLRYVASVRGLPAREHGRRIRKMLELCGLVAMVDREIGQLSKGFRQRVGLAQTLIHEPEILILDEPTTGLDPNQIVEIRDLIRTIGKERTVVLSTHILSEVEATCGRVIIVDDGTIVASGTPAELSARARGGTYWTVVLRAPEAAAMAKLRDLHGVTGVAVAAGAVAAGAAAGGVGGDGLVRLRVDGHDRPELGEEIFRAVAAAGWTLSELRREAASLEHVFRELTGKERVHA